MQTQPAPAREADAAVPDKTRMTVRLPVQMRARIRAHARRNKLRGWDESEAMRDLLVRGLLDAQREHEHGRRRGGSDER